MGKWLIAILSTLILLVALALGVFLWSAMTASLQDATRHNLAALRQTLEFDDPDLSFEFDHFGMEPHGVLLAPSFTLMTPAITLKTDQAEYQLAAEEASIIGGWADLQHQTVELPEEMRLQVTPKNGERQRYTLRFTAPVRFQLIGQSGTLLNWQHYRAHEAIEGDIEILQNDTVLGRHHYRITPGGAREITPPFSNALHGFLKNLLAQMKAGS